LRGAPFATAAADGADTVALRVDAPPAKIRAPLGRNRRVALAGEPFDRLVRLPRIELTLEPLGALGLGLLHVAHAGLRKNKSRMSDLVRSPGFCLRLRLIASVVSRSLRHVPQRYLHPRFTARALRSDASGRGFDFQDRVADDHFLLATGDDFRAAHRAPTLLSRRHHWSELYIPDRNCQECEYGTTSN